MKKTLRYYYLVSGLMIALIGVIHCGFAPMMLKQMQAVEPLKDKATGMIYFFILGGIAFSYWGLVMAFARKQVDGASRRACLLPTSAMALIAISGLFAIVWAGFGNPFVYVMTFLSGSSLLLAVGSRVFLDRDATVV